MFPLIGEALDKRAKTIEGEIDAAAELRQQADKVLEEYRERLKEARAQSEEIVQRARQTAESHEHEASRARAGDPRAKPPSAPSATSRPPASGRSTTFAVRSPT